MVHSHLSAERPAERVRAPGRGKSWYALGVGEAVGADGSEEVRGDVQLLGGAFLRLGPHRAAGTCPATERLGVLVLHCVSLQGLPCLTHHNFRINISE